MPPPKQDSPKRPEMAEKAILLPQISLKGHTALMGTSRLGSGAGRGASSDYGQATPSAQGAILRKQPASQEALRGAQREWDSCLGRVKHASSPLARLPGEGKAAASHMDMKDKLRRLKTAARRGNGPRGRSAMPRLS